MLDAFGFDQPSLLSPFVLGGRFANIIIPADGINSLYLEVMIPGKLWAAGLPMPLRDNRTNVRLGSPGILGSPYAIVADVWGSISGGSGTGQVTVTLGPDIISSAINPGGFLLSVLFHAAGTSWRNIVGSGALNGASYRITQTLTLGMNMDQPLAILALTDTDGSGTIDGALVRLIPLLPWPKSDSVVG